MDALTDILATTRDRFERVLIVSEGLYSMDGDGPDLGRLADIKERFACWLMVDDAHALGVFGKTGRGIFEMAGIDPGRVEIGWARSQDLGQLRRLCRRQSGADRLSEADRARHGLQRRSAGAGGDSRS